MTILDNTPNSLKGNVVKLRDTKIKTIELRIKNPFFVSTKKQKLNGQSKCSNN